jgi:hypothetical protein
VQNRHDTFGVMLVRGGDIDRQRDTVFVYGNMELDAPDLLPAVDAAVKATRRRATGSTIDATALGSGLSPQASRQVRRSRLSNRRQRPSQVQRANSP